MEKTERVWSREENYGRRERGPEVSRRAGRRQVIGWKEAGDWLWWWRRQPRGEEEEEEDFQTFLGRHTDVDTVCSQTAAAPTHWLCYFSGSSKTKADGTSFK